MLRPFEYKPRPADVIQQQSTKGNEFLGIFKRNLPLYKMRENENAIRILPRPAWEMEKLATKNFGESVWTHWIEGPQSGSVLCPARHSPTRMCPICETNSRYQREGQKELAAKYHASQRLVVWVLDQKNPNEGPQLVALSHALLSVEINLLCRDRQTGAYLQIDDPDNGFDIYFNKEGQKRNTKYRGVELARSPSQIPNRDANLAFITEHLIPDCLIYRTYEEVAALFAGEPLPAPTSARGSSPSVAPAADDEIPFDKYGNGAQDAPNVAALRASFGRPAASARSTDDDEVPF